MMLHLFFALAFVSVSIADRAVVFEPRTSEHLVGEDYIRPKASNQIHDLEKYATAASSTCDVEQVHITVGDQDGSIIVSYATPGLQSKSTVFYGLNQHAVQTATAAGGGVMVAYGTPLAYSQLISLSLDNLLYPSMGKPAETVADVLKLVNTYTWAFDPVTKEHFKQWANVTQLSYGLQSYKNPYMYYDSPLIHTVTLTGLKSRTVYKYRFHFFFKF